MAVGRAWIWPAATELGAVGTRSLMVAVMSRLRRLRFRSCSQPLPDLFLMRDLVGAEAAARTRGIDGTVGAAEEDRGKRGRAPGRAAPPAPPPDRRGTPPRPRCGSRTPRSS